MFNCRNCFVFQLQADFMILESLTVHAAHLIPLTPPYWIFFLLLSREKLDFFSALSLGLRPACLSSPSRHLPSAFVRWALPQPSCTQWCEFRVPGRGPHTSGNPCGISRESLTEKWRGTSRVLFLFCFIFLKRNLLKQEPPTVHIVHFLILFLGIYRK